MYYIRLALKTVSAYETCILMRVCREIIHSCCNRKYRARALNIWPVGWFQPLEMYHLAPGVCQAGSPTFTGQVWSPGLLAAAARVPAVVVLAQQVNAAFFSPHTYLPSKSGFLVSSET